MPVVCCAGALYQYWYKPVLEDPAGHTESLRSLAQRVEGVEASDIQTVPVDRRRIEEFAAIRQQTGDPHDLSVREVECRELAALRRTLQEGRCKPERR